MIHKVRCISGLIHFSDWVHEPYWRLLSWVSIIHLISCHHIFLQFFCYHGFLFWLETSGKNSHYIEGFPLSIPINVLVWILPRSDFTSNIIVIIFFSDSAAVSMTKISLRFPCQLVFVGRLGVNCNPYDINNSLKLGLKLLKKVASISSGDTKSYGNASI